MSDTVMFMIISLLVIMLILEMYIYKLIRIKNLNLVSYKAMYILDERFAKGDINEEEYKVKKNEIYKCLY